MNGGARALRDVTVLVAGATGFIGRAVAEALARAGAELVLPAREPETAAALFGTLGFDGHVVGWDAGDLESVARVVERFRPAIAFNLVGYGIDPAERDPALAKALNDRFARSLGELLVRYRDRGWAGQALIHVGSALEYGAAAGDLDETTAPAPSTLYGRSKLAGTTGVAEIAATTGLPALTARLFTVYGPGERRGRLLPSLLAAAAAADGPLALTEGRQRRDFTYVGDVAEGLLRLGASETAPGEIVNLATGRLMEVREFVRIAARILAIAPERLRFGALPSRPAEMTHDPVSLERLLRLTGWRPGTPVEGGIELTRALEARPKVSPTT